MRKILLLIAILLMVPVRGWATDYYAEAGCANKNIDTSDGCTWDTNPAGSGTDLVWANRQNGDNLYANGVTGIKVNTDPGGASVTVTIRTDAGAGTAGGGFTYATASNLTMHANITAGTTTCLSVSGSTGGGTVTGKVIGGAASTTYGVTHNHTTVNMAYGDVDGGSNSSGYGLYVANSGTVSVTGTVTGKTAAGINMNNTGTATLNNVVGSSDAYVPGAQTSNGAITITGNMINGSKGVAAQGAVKWTPASANNYIKTDGGGTAVYASVPPDGNKILPSATFVNSTNGTPTAGTAPTGGGAWSF